MEVVKDDGGAASDGNRRIRAVLGWVVTTTVAIFAIGPFVVILRAGFREGLHADLYFMIFRDHFATVVGLPMAAVAALFVVLILRSSEGPLKLKALGIELEGQGQLSCG